MRTVTGRTDRVVVVGAGLAGLAAALHLAGRGRQVTVLERAQGPGGCAGRRDVGGYRLDTGPTVLTMREVLAETFAAVGDSLDRRLTLLPVEPAYQTRFADGSRLAVHSDPDVMVEQIRRFAGDADAHGYLRLRAWLGELFRAQFDRFIAANIDSPLALVGPQLARLVALGGFGTLDRKVAGFLHDERLRRVFTFQALYAGVAPHRALAAYGVIAYLDTVAGVFFPRGGVHAVPDALAAAGADAGVEFRYGASVAELERRGDRITAACTEAGERHPCDAVVLATDPAHAYALLGRVPRRPVPLRAAPSAVVVHTALPAGSTTAHHTVSFGAAWRSAFRELITDGRVMSDPSLLITRPTATDPGLAPPGRDLVSVLAPVPNLQRGRIDWDARRRAYAQELIELAQRRLGPDLAGPAEILAISTPADWARAGMTAGTPFSYAHTLAQTGPFRPGNLPGGTGNAVLAGAGTVPGVGVPMALLSGRLAADRVTGVV